MRLADKLLLNGGRPRPVLNWMQLNLGLALYFPLSGFKLAKFKCSFNDLVDVHLSPPAFIVRLHNVFRDGDRDKCGLGLPSAQTNGDGESVRFHSV